MLFNASASNTVESGLPLGDLQAVPAGVTDKRLIESVTDRLSGSQLDREYSTDHAQSPATQTVSQLTSDETGLTP